MTQLELQRMNFNIFNMNFVEFFSGIHIQATSDVEEWWNIDLHPTKFSNLVIDKGCNSWSSWSSASSTSEQFWCQHETRSKNVSDVSSRPAYCKCDDERLIRDDASSAVSRNWWISVPLLCSSILSMSRIDIGAFQNQKKGKKKKRISLVVRGPEHGLGGRGGE